jgi:hypothetical protein
MTIFIPGAMFAAGISLYLFYEFHRVKEAKQLERRDSLHDRRQQYLRQLIEAKKKADGKAQAASTNEPPEDAAGNSDSNSP